MSGQLKNKMADYEVIPPNSIWESIANKLEEIPSATPLPFSEKMNAYEVPPPPAAWQDILAGLEKIDAKESAHVKRIFSIHSFKWLSAAAIFGFLVIGSYYFLNKSDQGKNNIASNNSIGTIDQEKEIVVRKKHISATLPVRLAMVNHEDNGTKNNNSNEDYKNLHWTSLEEAAPIILNEHKIYITPRPILNAKGELIQDMSVINPNNNKYINITAPNGEQTKISSKLASMLHYFGSTTNNDFSFNDNCNAWQQRINEWRQKVIRSGLVPSSTNFLDIVEFTKLIEEN